MSKDPEQLSFTDNIQIDNQPVVCLGMTFKSDEERREYFRNELRKKLPELKHIEGFPIGRDEDIVALSDPPYYTICPNPWILEFIKEAEEQKSKGDNHEVAEVYPREPYVADVSEGKNDPIYNVHTYHTKVPYKAIMRYILHYTEPGDIVFDGFAGTGMTGVAAYMCGDKEAIESLGYGIDEEERIYNYDKDENNSITINNISKLGARRAILNDLSPIASFISHNYNKPLKKEVFRKRALSIYEKVKKEYGFFYSTLVTSDENLRNEIVEKLKHSNSIESVKQVLSNYEKYIGQINYVLWSDVFQCNECASEIIYSDVAVDYDNKTVHKDFICPNCGVKINKRSAKHLWETSYDIPLGDVVNQAKQTPFKINYTYNQKRFEKRPDEFDKILLEKISDFLVQFQVPAYPVPSGYNTNQPMESHGFTHIHHFYTKRNLAIISAFWNELASDMKWLLTSFISRNATKMNRYIINKHNPRGRINGPLTGTLYIPSLIVEQSVLQLYMDKIIDTEWNTEGNLIQVSSSTDIKIQDNCVDYIFLDPPFGANIMYSEVNVIWESWLAVWTNNSKEAIQNSSQSKDINDYRDLMTSCFKECYRILKPGKWMTVEFSNTQASVWNSIQLAIQEAGFIVANVSILDKKHGGIRAMSNPTSVKQDLVISVYKPREELISVKSGLRSVDENIVWSFVRQHLEFLPPFIGRLGQAYFIVERDPRVLYDRTIAYFITKGVQLPLSSAEFQEGLRGRFAFQDGMVFLEDQIAEYNKKKVLVKEFSQMSLFVSDETSAIEWIRQQLMKKPQTRQDLHPNFMKEIQHIAKHEMLPELDDLLYQNFLRYDGDGSVPDQIASYLRKNYKDLRGLENDDAKLKDKAMNRWYVPDPNKQADLEKLREKSLLREFESYIEEFEKSKKKLKQFRTEAIRAGFKKAWSDKDYQKIVTVGERLPESVIQEDDKLLMYYDNAQIRLGL